MKTSAVSPSVQEAILGLGRHASDGGFLVTMTKGVGAGFLIAALGWLLAGRQSGEVVLVFIITYVVALSGFSHVVAGTVEMAALVIVGQIVLSRTVFVRYVKVVGANEEAATFSGINSGPVKIAVFVIAGALAGLGAAFASSKVASVDPNAGIGLELSAIAAVVIGGTSLMGGRGSVVGSFIGVLIMATLGTGLAQIGASEPVKLLITGVVIVVAVLVDAWRAGKMKQLKP